MRQTLKESLLNAATDGRKLLQTEITLARIEVGDNVSRAITSTKAMAIGAAFLLVAVVFLGTAGILWLAARIGLVAAFATIGAICGLVAIALLVGGRIGFARTRVLPRRAIARLGRNINQLTDRADAARAGNRD